VATHPERDDDLVRNLLLARVEDDGVANLLALVVAVDLAVERGRLARLGVRVERADGVHLRDRREDDGDERRP